MVSKRRWLWLSGLCLAAGCQSGPLAYGPPAQRGVYLGRPMPAYGAASTEVVMTSPRTMRPVAPQGWMLKTPPQQTGTQEMVVQNAAPQPAAKMHPAMAATPLKPALEQGASGFLKPGAQIEWTCQNAQQTPGQVTSGKAHVGPDGSIVLGPYGTCQVGGLSLAQATMAIERHLSPYISRPNVRLSTMMPPSSTPNEVLWRSAAHGMPTYVTPNAMPVMHQTVHRPNYAVPSNYAMP